MGELMTKAPIDTDKGAIEIELSTTGAMRTSWRSPRQTAAST